MKVHEKIRFMREERNWSQEEMAVKLNMSLNGYSKIERGETKVHIPKLEKIAEILEMDIVELMALGEKCIYLNGNDNNTIGYNIFGSTELAFENQKLQLMLELKDKELAMQQRENENLREIIALLKNKNA
jgi:transcriptional regulator with XRE-family HTH domain